jgi:hypothetical protein
VTAVAELSTIAVPEHAAIARMRGTTKDKRNGISRVIAWLLSGHARDYTNR